MDQPAIQAAWALGGEQAMACLGQPVTWKNKPLTAIVDGLTYGVELRTKGGGAIEQFSGSIVFLKTAFIDGVTPVVGDTISLPGREVEIKGIEGTLDITDPFLTCFYEPVLGK